LNRVRNICLVALIVAATILCSFGVVLELQTSRAIQQVDAGIAETSRHLSLTLENADRLIIVAGATATETQKASAEERKYLATLNRKVARDLDDVHEVLQDARLTLSTADASIAEIKPLLEDAQDSVTKLQPVLTHVDETAAGLSKIANDPNIPKAIDDARQTSDAVKHAAQKGDELATKTVDDLEKPKKWLSHIWMNLLEAAYYARGIF
jgi:hypothetical protein